MIAILSKSLCFQDQRPQKLIKLFPLKLTISDQFVKELYQQKYYRHLKRHKCLQAQDIHQCCNTDANETIQ